MLETVRKDRTEKNTFVLQFIDKDNGKLSAELSNEINQYKTNDGSIIKMGLRINAIPPAIQIDIKIQYPSTFYTPNYYELLDSNEKQFQDFYNKIMNYDSMGYKIIGQEESYPNKFLVQ